jgi:protein-S-isoprenylcysteine O-methyltransferase Ste14
VRALLLVFSGICFASFGWGMVRHFRRFGRSAPAMRATGLLAMLFCALNLVGLAGRPFFLPWLSALLYASGAVLFWSAVRVTRDKLAACGQRAVSPALVTSGPYRYVRHPFYAAYNLTWIAGFAATGWWPLGAAAVAMAALYDYFARQEERAFLATPLAAEYEVYRARTGRYFPNTAPNRSGR